MRKILYAAMMAAAAAGTAASAQTTTTTLPGKLGACVDVLIGTVREEPSSANCIPFLETYQTVTLQGPQGATGTTGAAGLPGLTGARGSSGPAGATGAAGAAGAMGPAGATGAPGIAGQAGAQGPAGPQGATGATGGAGAAGSAGLAGPAGATGAAGATGVAGVAGSAGANGSQGPQGPAGATGATGAAGTAGAAGIQFAGSYSTTASYGPASVVLYSDGALYLHSPNSTTTKMPPPSSGGAWTTFLPAATAGSMGPEGSRGLTGALGATGATGGQTLVGGIHVPVGIQGPDLTDDADGFYLSLAGQTNNINLLPQAAALPLPNSCSRLLFTGTITGATKSSNYTSDFYVPGYFDLQPVTSSTNSAHYGTGSSLLCEATPAAGTATVSCSAELDYTPSTVPAAATVIFGANDISGFSNALVTTQVTCMP